MLFCWSGDHTLRITGLDGLWGSSWLSGSLELYHTVPTDGDACLIYLPACKTLTCLCSQLWSPCMKHMCSVLEGLLASEPIRGSSTCEPIGPASSATANWPSELIFTIFIGRTDAETEAPILWPPDAKSWLIRKDPDSGKDWRQDEKGKTEDEMVWMVPLTQETRVWASTGIDDGQGSLACCSSWGHKELDTTEQLNWLLMCFWVKVWWTFQPASYFLLTWARAAWASWTPRHQIAISSERLIHWSSHCAGRATEAAQWVPGKMSLESCSPNSMTAALSSQQVFASVKPQILVVLSSP